MIKVFDNLYDVSKAGIVKMFHILVEKVEFGA